MTRRYGIAVIGAGDMGNRHVKAWQLAGHDVLSITDGGHDQTLRATLSRRPVRLNRMPWPRASERSSWTRRAGLSAILLLTSARDLPALREPVGTASSNAGLGDAWSAHRRPCCGETDALSAGHL